MLLCNNKITFFFNCLQVFIRSIYDATMMDKFMVANVLGTNWIVERIVLQHKFCCCMDDKEDVKTDENKKKIKILKWKKNI